jgi:dTDP-4-dehydrorhamnose 3,5-epimerase
MIDGVKTKKLKVVPDERGRLMEILRADDELFTKFGQVYMTTTFPGVVKGWHFHEKQADNICCVQGQIKLALYDPRPGSPTKGEVAQFYLGVHNPLLVHVPAGVYHGWMGVGTEEAFIINLPTEPYDHARPDEHRVDPHVNDIPYRWERKDG